MFIYFAPFSALFATRSDKMSDSCVLKSKEKTRPYNLDWQQKETLLKQRL